MSKKYDVRVPFAGYIVVQVEADSEQEAIQDAIHSDVRIDLHGDDIEAKSIELSEWDLYEKCLQGNVCYLSLWEAEADEL